MFFLEYHDRGGGGGVPDGLKKILPQVISEIPGLPCIVAVIPQHFVPPKCSVFISVKSR